MNKKEGWHNRGEIGKTYFSSVSKESCIYVYMYVCLYKHQKRDLVQVYFGKKPELSKKFYNFPFLILLPLLLVQSWVVKRERFGGVRIRVSQKK